MDSCCLGPYSIHCVCWRLPADKKLLIPFLKDNADTIDLCDVCYTSTARRQIYNYRSSISASSMGELAEKLEHADYTEVKKGAVSLVIFVFSGQGSQYISMGRELLYTSTIFRKTVLDCESWLQNSGFPGCLRIIDQEAEGAEDPNSQEYLQAMQISIFVVEVGLARMWGEWGVQPAMVTGHRYVAISSESSDSNLEIGFWSLACSIVNLLCTAARVWLLTSPWQCCVIFAASEGSKEDTAKLLASPFGSNGLIVVLIMRLVPSR